MLPSKVLLKRAGFAGRILLYPALQCNMIMEQLTGLGHDQDTINSGVTCVASGG
jgi:hypothetical protein